MYSKHSPFVSKTQVQTEQPAGFACPKTNTKQSLYRSSKRWDLWAWLTVLLLAICASQAAVAAVTPDITVSFNQQTGARAVSAPSFSTRATNELLLAYIATDSVTTPNTTVTNVTGGGLTWVCLVRTNVQEGTSEIWRAFAPAELKSITVTASLSQNVASMITVQTYTGVAVSGSYGSGAIGAFGNAHSAKGAAATSLVTTTANAMIVGVGNDYDQAIARTPLAGQSIVSQDLTSTGDTYWVQRTNATNLAKGTRLTFGDSAPTSDQYNLSFCEILPASSPQVTLSATSLAFGSVVDGSSKPRSITLTSSGAQAVTVKSATITGTGFSLAVIGLPKTLSAGQTLSLPVIFAPKTAGPVSGKLTIVSDSAVNATSGVALSGSGVAATSQLTPSASTLAFGNVTDATTRSLVVTLTSSGNVPVSVNGATITGTGFSLGTTGLPKTLAPGQTLSVPVTFAPKTAGAVTGKITITSNSTTSTIALSGTGVAATSQLTLSTTTLAFGNVTDATTTSLALTLSASGTAAVTVNSATITGTGFSLGATGLPKTLTPGQTLSIPVTFAPKTAGAATGRISVSSTAISTPTSTVTLTGTGVATSPQLTLSATTLAFGNVTDATSKALAVTLTSSGTAAVTVNSATITGTGFTLGTTGLPKTLAPGQTLSIPVTFAPKTAGAVTGKITITSNAASGTTSTIALTGIGVATTSQLTLSATTLAFGNVNDAATKSLAVTLTSSGTAAVTVNSAAITGTGFTLGATGLPKTLSPGQTLSIPVTFAPATAGAVTGKITITSNATSGTTSTIALTGTGVATTSQLTLSATTLAFGNVNDGTTKSLVVTLTSSGTAAVTVNSAAITGTGFTLGATTLPKTLAQGQSLSIPITFSPTAAGNDTGKITITSNATSGTTSAITLTGTGVAATTAQLTVSTNSLAFGSVGDTSNKTMTLTLTSSGTAAVTVNSASITGSAFTFTSGSSFPVTLAPKQTLMLTVSFEPVAVGAATGTLTISSNSSVGASSSIALTGTGTASTSYSVDLSWNAPTSSADPVVGYHLYRSSGLAAAAMVDSSLVTQTSYVDTSVVMGTTYTYEVKSVDASGVESTSSNVFEVTIPAS